MEKTLLNFELTSAIDQWSMIRTLSKPSKIMSSGSGRIMIVTIMIGRIHRLGLVGDQPMGSCSGRNPNKRQIEKKLSDFMFCKSC